MEIVTADIGGTHARFAIAEISDGVIKLGPETVLRTGEYPGLDAAWRAFGEVLRRPLPHAAGIAVAGPIDGDEVRLTNNRWILHRDRLGAQLALDRFTLVNDFAAVAHAVTTCGEEHLRHVCGPETPLPKRGVVSVVGPGTGLGVAILRRGPSGHDVIATEGGHIAFAPLDPTDGLILEHLRRLHGRVSVERVVSGAGLVDIHAALTGRKVADRALWALALSGEDADAARSLDRLCISLGAVAGDLALAHGADAVVIAGGLGLRLAEQLAGFGFAKAFVAKGRFELRMAGLPVKLITHPQPGLLGAAAAFMSEHGA